MSKGTGLVAVRIDSQKLTPKKLNELLRDNLPADAKVGFARVWGFIKSDSVCLVGVMSKQEDKFIEFLEKDRLRPFEERLFPGIFTAQPVLPP